MVSIKKKTHIFITEIRELATFKNEGFYSFVIVILLRIWNNYSLKTVKLFDRLLFLRYRTVKNINTTTTANHQ